MIEKWRRYLVRLRQQESGTAAVEYAVVLALIGVVSIGAISTLGQNVATSMQQVADAMDSSPEMMPSPRGPSR